LYWQGLALVLTALALVPAGAHLFEMAHKLGLGREAYFIAQGLYNGWALLGTFMIAAMILNAWLAWRGASSRAWHGAAALLLAAALANFFAFTYPANQATRNWTSQPENWELLRRQWEYSHAVGAVLVFAALCAVVVAVLKRG